jgi:hypothetical protein
MGKETGKIEEIRKQLVEVYDSLLREKNPEGQAVLNLRSADLHKEAAELGPKNKRTENIGSALTFYHHAFQILRAIQNPENPERIEREKAEIREKIDEINKAYGIQQESTDLAQTEAISTEINRLEGRLKQVEGTHVGNDKEEKQRLKNKLALSSTIGADYERLGDITEKSDKPYYAQGIRHFANAASEAFLLGREKEAKEYYMKAAHLSKKLGDQTDVKYFTQRARDSNRRAIRRTLDERIKGTYIFILFGAVLLSLSPRLTGNVTGFSFSLIDYPALAFFILFIVSLILKVYSKRI